MKQRGMIEPLLCGKLEEAVHKGAPEWASLPGVGGGGYYAGQSARSMAEIKRVYYAALERYQSMPVTTTP
jgi:hypothetical protein